MTSQIEERLHELQADNRRLRRLLEQRDAPAELRHRLRRTIAMLRAIIRKSAQSSRDLDDYVAHVEDRLDALARAQAAADEDGAVDLHKLMADELFNYDVSEGDRVQLSGPSVSLSPRSGQVIALAIHELVVNAVEHGRLGIDGRVTATWTIEQESDAAILTIMWKELDAEPQAVPSHEGFGMEVLKQMLPYQLKAKTDLSFEQGVQCTIRLPLPEQSDVASNIRAP